MISGGMLERLKRGVCGQELNFSISSGFSTVNEGKHGESPVRIGMSIGRPVGEAGVQHVEPLQKISLPDLASNAYQAALG